MEAPDGLKKIQYELERDLRSLRAVAMILHLFECTSEAEKVDQDVLSVARSEQVGFLNQYVDSIWLLFHQFAESRRQLEEEWGSRAAGQ